MLGNGYVSRKYSESLVREYYANLTADIDDLNYSVVSQVYVRDQVITFSAANIFDFMSCPYYSNIKGTGLEEDFDPDVIEKVLAGDQEAHWLDNNCLQLT